jgi:ABC-type bacteriocin/lantibiotic exporter with double-glycine peptidase domain
VALARALAMNPRILVLDEPLSSLDPETEQSLVNLLRELARDKTVIIAAHRLPPSLKPDRTYVLNQGTCAPSD